MLPFTQLRRTVHPAHPDTRRIVVRRTERRTVDLGWGQENARQDRQSNRQESYDQHHCDISSRSITARLRPTGQVALTGKQRGWASLPILTILKGNGRGARTARHCEFVILLLHGPEGIETAHSYDYDIISQM
jgi:hypothetical protein